MQLHLPPGEPPVALQLWNTAQVMGAAFDEYLAGAGGSRYHFFVFDALGHTPDASQRALAKAVGVDDATITHHLNAMERAGLITRTRSPEDRRVHRIALTHAGQDLHAAMVKAVDRYNAEVFATIAPKDLQLLAGLLARIGARASVMASNAPPAARQGGS